jgi:hypothetical protein
LSRPPGIFFVRNQPDLGVGSSCGQSGFESFQRNKLSSKLTSQLDIRNMHDAIL